MATFIIAEIGINHNGSVEIARKLIDAAKWAGADAVKFQKRTVEVVYKDQLHLPRESPWGTTLGQQKMGLEFNKLQYDLIGSYCLSVGMPWFCSAWDLESLAFLRGYDLPYNKIASAMATNYEFVCAVAAQGTPTFMSTAMCTVPEIHNALTWIDAKRCPVTPMHCVATYPAEEADLNLMMIPKLARMAKRTVGFSDHSASLTPAVVAVCMGAVAIEKHITLDRSMYGSDQAASFEPDGFRRMVNMIRKIPVVLGDGHKKITEDEEKVAKKLRYWNR